MATECIEAEPTNAIKEQECNPANLLKVCSNYLWWFRLNLNLLSPVSEAGLWALPWVFTMTWTQSSPRGVKHGGWQLSHQEHIPLLPWQVIAAVPHYCVFKCTKLSTAHRAATTPVSHEPLHFLFLCRVWAVCGGGDVDLPHWCTECHSVDHWF